MNRKLKKIIKLLIKLLTLGLAFKENKKEDKKVWRANTDNYYQYSDTSSEEVSSDPNL